MSCRYMKGVPFCNKFNDIFNPSRPFYDKTVIWMKCVSLRLFETYNVFPRQCLAIFFVIFKQIWLFIMFFVIKPCLTDICYIESSKRTVILEYFCKIITFIFLPKVQRASKFEQEKTSIQFIFETFHLSYKMFYVIFPVSILRQEMSEKISEKIHFWDRKKKKQSNCFPWKWKLFINLPLAKNLNKPNDSTIKCAL